MRSVVFVSLHKCATTFFSHYLFPREQSLRFIDPQNDFYLQHQAPPSAAPIADYGHLYGVLRLHDPDHPITPLTDRFLFEQLPRGLRTLILIRDPRDLLVSMYYSFGQSHPLSPNPLVRDYQLRRRQRIQGLSLDQFAIESAVPLVAKFLALSMLAQRQYSSAILKYEDMINDFDAFFDRLSLDLSFDGETRAQAYARTRPREQEDIGAHRRSGHTGAYAEKLAPATIREVNRMLTGALSAFGYE